MRSARLFVGVMAAIALQPHAEAAPGAGTVTITPLGSHPGEVCFNDRALLFEDPTGVRVLYDPGRTIDGGNDPRLGEVHVIILSHAHADHLGERHTGSAGCGGNPAGAAYPQSILAEVASARSSAVFLGGELPPFIAQKIRNVRGGATAPATETCPASGLANELVVPRSAPCTAPLRQGASRTVKLAGAAAGVKIAAVQAVHTNGIPAVFLDPPGVAPGTPANAGDAVGFVLRFSNGLVVYLSGDTGMFGDMETVIRRYHGANLAVINIGDIFQMGPDEAAFATRQLLKPVTVIPSHTTEASTSAGAPLPGSRLERFIQQLGGSAAVVVPLSDVARSFDGSGRCVDCP